MTFSLEILGDMLEEVQGLDVLEWGLERFKAKLSQMEEAAIARLREQGIPVRKVKRTWRSYLFPAASGLVEIKMRRYTVRIEGEHLVLLDKLVNPEWKHTRGPLPSLKATERLGQIACDTRSYRRLARTLCMGKARVYRLTRRASEYLSSTERKIKQPKVSEGETQGEFLQLFLDGFYLSIRENGTGRYTKLEFKMAVIRAPGITCLYTSLDAWKKKLSFNEGLFRFLLELFPDLIRRQGVVVGDGASWIKAFRDDYLFHFHLQVDMFHLARQMRLLKLQDVYQKLKRPEAGLEEIICSLRQALKRVKDEAVKERILSLMSFIRKAWKHLRTFLKLPPQLAVMGSGAVEGYIARAKDRLGRRAWSTSGLVDFWCILKTSEGW